ncbi:oxidoreductase [Halocynthiibacter namhaensis]|uniref:oxidoreductase n=1 Tax=Halocynthiibacter namhaensis TaxID=1290553 RepID=UPI00057973B6|nr:oxidoreductase [Halocynthiibacter namhaensis]
MTPLKVGLLGFGGAGQVFHAPLIQVEPGLQLCKIGSRNFAGKQLPQGVQGASIQDVIDDPLIDLIVIATPNDSHASLAKLALLAGKHVVVDKPFTVTLSEASELVTLAQEQQRLLSVFHNRRWDGGFITAQKILPDLGEISFAEFHFDRFSPQIKQRWREEEIEGAGILYDLGPHLLDQIICMFGMPKAVMANLARQRNGAKVDDFFHIMLEYGERRVVAHASSLMRDHAPRIALYGSDASFFQYGLDGQEVALKRGVSPGSRDWGQTLGGYARLMRASGAEEEIPLEAGCYEVFYKNISDEIHHGRSTFVTAEQALDVMHVLIAAQESALAHKRISL